MAPHHRSVDPERIHHLGTLPHGDSSVSPEFHPPRRLDDLPGPAGRISSGSSASRFASFPSLRGSRKDLPVQGPLFRSYNRPSSLHEDYGTSVRHPSIDLFATSLTARLPVYFSLASDPRAAGTDALLQSWDDLQAYAFPPIAIIRRVLRKLRSSKNCELTLIAPFWPQRDWFPDLLELLSDVPITLSGRRDLLRQPHFHRFHLNLPMLQLTAWRLSSDSPSRPASLLRWLDSLSSVEDCPHT